MKDIKRGDSVTRNSYNNDIIFKVDKIIISNNTKVAILKGIDVRIIADSEIGDLKLVSRQERQNSEAELKKRVKNSIKNNDDERIKGIIKTGKILHLDGELL